MTKQELKIYLESLVNKTVSRKTSQNVKGVVVGYSARNKNDNWAIKLRVEWEGASNGTRRFNGSKWNTTSTIKIESLLIES